jgi:hypothetical protein
MKKWIIFFASFIFVIAICFSSYLYLYRAEFASNALSKLYGTPVKIQKIRVTQNDIEFQNVTVFNPSEYILQPALQINKVFLKMTPLDALSSIFAEEPITIKKVRISDPQITIETQDSKNNWKKLLLPSVLSA